MKAIYLYFALIISFLSFGQKSTNTIGFIENKGQIIDQKGKENKAVKYLLNTNGLNVQLRENGFSYDVYEVEQIPFSKADRALYPSDANKKDNTAEFSTKITFHRIDIDFLNANKNTLLLAEEKSADYDNYYNVIHAPEGITNVHKYKKVTYKNLYNHIDVVFFIPQDSTKVVEYNFIIKPGGKVSDIQLKFSGAKTDLIDHKIQMNLRFGKMEETLPLSWVESDNTKEEISVNFKKIKKGVYGFEGELNNSHKTIVIDPVPVRLWGTYYGDETNIHYSLGPANVTTDTNGNSYMSGTTTASNASYATSGAHQTFIPQFNYLSSNGIIVKFNPDGNRLWGTYYGGTGLNNLLDIKSDSQNNIIITGSTQAETNISTNGAHKPNLSGIYDAYLVKFNDLGVRIWGTYFGGDDNDEAAKMAIDDLDNIYIVGHTFSLSGIAFNCNFQPQLYTGPQYNVDGFIAKFNPNGNIIWGTYVGGENIDHLTSVAVKGNYLVVGGNTLSFTNIATSGVFQQVHNPITHLDGMIYKFSNSGSRIWSTYYGGEQVDEIFEVEIDDEDNIYFGGRTASNTNMATTGSFESINTGGYSGYFVKLNNNGLRLWGSYLNDAPVNSIVFKNNSIYIGANNGFSNHPNWVNACSYRTNGFSEGYIGKFSKLGSLIWGTFTGGNSSGSSDNFIEIAFDNNKDIYVCGQTRASNTGVTDSNSYQQNILGTFNNYFIMKFHEGDLCSMEFQPTANSPICISESIAFNNIPSGFTYNWTGPNGFSSTIQNPTITNATTANNGLYTLIISDGTVCGCQKTYTFNILVEDNLSPVPSISNLPTINGNCNTIVNTIPTALDNCAGTITATTSDPLTYSIPGSYIITWNYNDGNGNSTSQSQIILITETDIPIVNQTFYYCPDQNPTINNILITGQNITWYDAAAGGTILTSTTALQDGVTYYATQTIDGCESDRVPVLVNIQNTPAPSGIANQTFCTSQNATLADILLNGSSIIWYTDNTSTTPLSNDMVLADDISYFATQTINGCESATRFEVHIDLINTLNAVDYQEMLCDDLNNGYETINLTNYNSNFITEAGNTFSYYTTLNGAENQISATQINNTTSYSLSIGTTTFFVRIDSQNGCHQVVELQLTLFRKPQIAIKDIMPICEGTSITINAGSGYDSYLWSTGETTQSIVVLQTGNYSVTVTENHPKITCSSTKNFTVVNSNAATISEIITSDWTDNNNTITVILTNASVGNYVYSIDGENYQSSNVFTGLQTGEYTVYVKDINGCGIIDEEIYLLMYPKYFTPNGDSYNDTWNIKFSQNEPDLKIAIFDRYGKLLKTMNSFDAWDGKFNGQDLPSTDYWFVVTRQNGKEFRGHFTLKR